MAASLIWRTSEAAPYARALFRQRRSLGLPCRLSSMVSCAASPMRRIRRHKVEPRHTSSGVAGSSPASTSSRQSPNTGVVPCAVIPSAEQRSEPISSAQTACVFSTERLFPRTTVPPSWVNSGTPRASSAAAFLFCIICYPAPISRSCVATLKSAALTRSIIPRVRYPTIGCAGEIMIPAPDRHVRNAAQPLRESA